jgi:hypothetical protein
VDGARWVGDQQVLLLRFKNRGTLHCLRTSAPVY